MRASTVLFIVAACTAPSAHAYLGPGLGLGALGAFFGILFAVFLGVVGLFWYPLKRTYLRMRGIESEEEETPEALAEKSQEAGAEGK